MFLECLESFFIGGIMLNLFKKTKEVKVNAPAKGTLCKLSEVKDTMFAQKLLGDGIAVLPSDGKICAPCDGELTMIANTAHAFGITTNHGAELLIHVGLDTVNLNGEGFEVLAKVNQKVKAGDPILKVNLTFMKEKEIDLTIPVVLTNGADFTLTILQDEGTCDTTTTLMQITKQ